MEILKSYFDVTDKVVIVTGASKGLGRGIAEAYASAGAKVYLISRNEKQLQENVEEIRSQGGNAHCIAGNVNELKFIDKAVDEVKEREDRIDILVNNAGVAFTGKVTNITEEDWDKTMDTNLKAVFFFSQSVAKVMKEQESGRIINMASILGTIADVMVSPYCASKGGVIQLTKAFALELARYNIQVNAIAPGYVRTEMNDKAFDNEEYHNYILSKTPLRRLGRVDEVAGTALFLASPIAEYITGQTICVDGGWTAK